MARKRPSFAWALSVSPDEAARLSSDSKRGLAYARELAENARQRKEEALAGTASDDLPYPASYATVAADWYTSATTVRRRIIQARTALYGSLSDRAIQYRQRQARIAGPVEGNRRCHGIDCKELLDWNAPRNKRYCAKCATPTARVRRTRGQPATKREPPYASWLPLAENVAAITRRDDVDEVARRLARARKFAEDEGEERR